MSDKRKSIRLHPSLFRAFGTPYKVLQHLGVHQICKIVVKLELINLFQLFLVEGLSIVMHLIGLPFCRVFVTVGNQAAVVPILVYVLHIVKHLTCCHKVLASSPQLHLQLQKRYSYNGRETAHITLSSKMLFFFPRGPLYEEGYVQSDNVQQNLCNLYLYTFPFYPN